MEYTVACNWDPELINRIDYPEVKSLFGGLPETLISGGRSSLLTRNVQENKIREYIQQVHTRGLNFDYNINSACLSNQELTASGYRDIMRYLEWVCSLGVDSLTISNTNLIEIVKKNFPQLKIKVSTYQKVSNPCQAKRFEDMGVDALMLSEHINRNFKILAAIRKSVKCKLVLVANVGCIYNCPNMHSHANCTAHSGAAGEVDSIFTEAYNLYCFQKRLSNREELIKIRWIRPEDVPYYEEIGIDMLKIIERSSSTQALEERVKAYSERKYDGNLLNFLGQAWDIKRTDEQIKKSITIKVKSENTAKAMMLLKAFSSSLPELFSLDNRKLGSDFIQSFINRDCNATNCSECGNCKKIAEETISIIDQKKLDIADQRIKEVRNSVIDGSLLY